MLGIAHHTLDLVVDQLDRDPAAVVAVPWAGGADEAFHAQGSLLDTRVTVVESDVPAPPYDASLSTIRSRLA